MCFDSVYFKSETFYNISLNQIQNPSIFTQQPRLSWQDLHLSQYSVKKYHQYWLLLQCPRHVCRAEHLQGFYLGGTGLLGPHNHCALWLHRVSAFPKPQSCSTVTTCLSLTLPDLSGESGPDYQEIHLSSWRNCSHSGSSLFKVSSSQCWVSSFK